MAPDRNKYFSDEDLEKIKISYDEVTKTYRSLLLTYTTKNFRTAEATEFARHGFARRLKTLARCIHNVFDLCPPNIDRKLSEDELADLVINLQAFILNVYGALDNLAWIWVKEKSILNKKGQPLTQNQVGFSKDYIRKSLPAEFQSYLVTLEKWFKHLEDFRHSLAHRIPLYVPPFVVNNEEAAKERELQQLRQSALLSQNFDEFERLTNEVDKIGYFVPFMTHSFSEDSPYAIFHAQIIVDWKTVVEIADKFLRCI